jgi:hypothetical protein
MAYHRHAELTIVATTPARNEARLAKPAWRRVRACVPGSEADAVGRPHVEHVARERCRVAVGTGLRADLAEGVVTHTPKLARGAAEAHEARPGECPVDVRPEVHELAADGFSLNGAQPAAKRAITRLGAEAVGASLRLGNAVQPGDAPSLDNAVTARAISLSGLPTLPPDGSLRNNLGATPPLAHDESPRARRGRLGCGPHDSSRAGEMHVGRAPCGKSRGGRARVHDLYAPRRGAAPLRATASSHTQDHDPQQPPAERLRSQGWLRAQLHPSRRPLSNEDV